MNNNEVTYYCNGVKCVGDRVDLILNELYGKVDYCTYENIRRDIMILIGKEINDD